MARYVLHRDDEDYRYDLESDSLEELRKMRSEGNRDFISRYYGVEVYDSVQHCYVNITTGERV